jgi:hypothetical protein
VIAAIAVRQIAWALKAGSADADAAAAIDIATANQCGKAGNRHPSEEFAALK